MAHRGVPDSPISTIDRVLPVVPKVHFDPGVQAMVILTDSSGVTIKRRIQDANHVRVGILQTALWVDGVRRAVRPTGIPHVEFTINDCTDLLAELDRAERGV